MRQSKLVAVSSKKRSKSRADQIDQLLVGIVVKDIRLLRIVEGEGMKAFVKYLEPGYELPSRKRIIKLLRTQYEKAVPILKAKILDSNGVALTSDVWTSNTMEVYISVTAHFISADWEMRSCVLQTKHFPERHTGQNISEAIQDTVTSFDIEVSKVKGVVHDTCANAELAGKLMFDLHGWSSVQCAAHKLQLAVNKGLRISMIARTIAATRKLVGHFKHSCLATTQLTLRQEQMNVPTRKLKQECVNRWNSTLHMIKSVHESRWPISAVLGDEKVTKKEDRNLDLKSEQWDLLKNSVESLELLEVATGFLSQEFNISCSCTYPITDGLASNILPKDDDLPVFKEFKRVVSDALKRRWSMDRLDVTKAPVFVTFFDPRFKGLKFLTDSERAVVHDHVAKLL